MKQGKNSGSVTRANTVIWAVGGGSILLIVLLLLVQQIAQINALSAMPPFHADHAPFALVSQAIRLLVAVPWLRADAEQAGYTLGTWLWNNGVALFSATLSALTVAGGTVIGAWRWSKERRAEQEKRKDEQFSALVMALTSAQVEARTMAAVRLGCFLQPGYERFAVQIFELVVSYLRLKQNDAQDADEPSNFRQALLGTLKKSFPLAREQAHHPLELDAAGLHLEGVYFAGADLKHIVMQNAFLNKANLSEADVSEANLCHSNLKGAHLQHTNFSGTHLEGACLEYAHLEGARLVGANLREAQLRHAHLSGADLTGADLRGADLRQSTLQEQATSSTPTTAVILCRAQLAGADLRGLDLRGADLRGADLRGADVSHALLDAPLPASCNRQHPFASFEGFLGALSTPMKPV